MIWSKPSSPPRRAGALNPGWQFGLDMEPDMVRQLAGPEAGAAAND